jgi:urea transport system permease protein
MRFSFSVVPIFILVLSLGLALSNLFFGLPVEIVSLAGKYLCYAFVALGLDLLWGYGGILSLGQGAFFALGAYAMGMYLMREIGGRGVYGNPTLPDFMVFLNWTKLPWYWHGFEHFPFAAFMALAVPGFLALVFGFLAFRSRVQGVYFSIISQALTYALMLAFFRNDMGFGGNNGLTDFKDILGFDLRRDGTRDALLVITGLLLAVVYLLCEGVVRSRFGKVIVALREAESRLRFLGYRTEYYKLVIFVLAAAVAGLGGALYTPQVGIINPSEFSPANSIEIVIWVALGGRGTLAGAILGTFLVNLAKTYFTTVLPELWLYVLGLFFILVTLYLPHGVIGLFTALRTAPVIGRPRRADVH